MDMEDEMEPVTAKRRFKRINRKTKTQVVFDEHKRREFLTGFRKRKQERKKRAQEELKQQLKEEKKRIRLESKEQYKKLTKSYQPIPELEEKLAQLHEVENTTVSILELDTDLLADNNFIIGRNRVRYDGIEDDEEAQVKTEPKEEKSTFKNKDGEEIELKTKKELKREIKKKATKIVKKSSAFKKLNKQEQIKQKKKSIKKKTLQIKKLEKSNKKKHKKIFSKS